MGNMVKEIEPFTRRENRKEGRKMKRQPMGKQQFDRLYGRFLPQLYRAALYLLGDGKAAARAAGEAFTRTAAAACTADERAFAVEAARRLCKMCERADRGLGGYSSALAEEVDARGAALLEQLGGLCFEDRELVVLSAVQNFSVCEIARILGMSEWAAGMRLRRAVEKVCACVGQPVAAGQQIS